MDKPEDITLWGVEPQAAARPKVFRVGNKMIATTPPKYKAYKDALTTYFKRLDKIEGTSLCMACVFGFPYKKGHTKKEKEKELLVKTTKPDFDNLIKPVADAMMDAGILTEDSSIWYGSSIKIYNETPFIHITIYENDTIDGVERVFTGMLAKIRAIRGMDGIKLQQIETFVEGRQNPF